MIETQTNNIYTCARNKVVYTITGYSNAVTAATAAVLGKGCVLVRRVDNGENESTAAGIKGRLLDSVVGASVPVVTGSYGRMISKKGRRLPQQPGQQSGEAHHDDPYTITDIHTPTARKPVPNTIRPINHPSHAGESHAPSASRTWQSNMLSNNCVAFFDVHSGACFTTPRKRSSSTK